MDWELVNKIIFLLFITATYVLRMPYVRRRHDKEVVESRIRGLELLLPLVAFAGFQLLPLIWILGGWPAVADYRTVPGLGLGGAAVFAVAVWLMRRAHEDLGGDWSASLQIRRDHQLVTGGIYAHLRHPIYAAHWLWAVAQFLLISNWVAGFAGLLGFAIEFFYRVPREEQMMVDHFGQAYRDYRARVGGIFPRLHRS